MQIALEHLTLSAVTPGLLALRVDIEDLPAGSDPVGTGFALHADALSHSTSWRAEDDRLVLTFAHVLPDGGVIGASWSGSAQELESLPSTCHAVRHLHFLRFTDPDIAAWPGIPVFWRFAQQVADQHYPAVAGLLSEHGLADGPDFVI